MIGRMADDETENVVPFRRPLEAEAALELIRRSLEDTGRMLGWTDHVYDQMAERGIVTDQVLTALGEGALLKGPTWDPEHKDWVCVLKKFVAGRPVHVVAGVHEVRQEVTVVTAY